METINNMTNDEMMDLIIKNTLRENYLLQTGDKYAIEKHLLKLYKPVDYNNIPRTASPM